MVQLACLLCAYISQGRIGSLNTLQDYRASHNTVKDGKLCITFLKIGESYSRATYSTVKDGKLLTTFQKRRVSR